MVRMVLLCESKTTFVAVNSVAKQFDVPVRPRVQLVAAGVLMLLAVPCYFRLPCYLKSGRREATAAWTELNHTSMEGGLG
jgi:hypothetical protein